jgi:hypothetical protein
MSESIDDCDDLPEPLSVPLCAHDSNSDEEMILGMDSIVESLCISQDAIVETSSSDLRSLNDVAKDFRRLGPAGEV